MPTSTRTILVTGGAGFIGSHLIEALTLDESNRIVSLDNYSTGDTRNHIDHPSVIYESLHTKDIDSLSRYEPSLVFHLGEYSRVELSLKEPAKVWASNATGTAAVLEFCRTRQVPLVYAASSTKFSLDEHGQAIDGPSLSPYTSSKAANVDLVHRYGKWFGESDRFRYAVAYFYNAYGPREISDGSYATVIGIFIRRYKARLPLFVTMPGTQRRNFTHVQDTAQGLIQVSQQMDGREYHLGHPTHYSIREVAEMFPGADIQYREAESSNRSGALCDPTTAFEIGWKPKHDLPTYVAEAIG